MGLGSGIRDPGSGKILFRIRVQGSKRHRIPDPDPQHWYQLIAKKVGKSSCEMKKDEKRLKRKKK
jgi:hypothetical protein